MPEERSGMSHEEPGRKSGEPNKGTGHESHRPGQNMDPERDRRNKEGQDKSGSNR